MRVLRCLIIMLFAQFGVDCRASDARLVIIGDDTAIARTATELLVQAARQSGYAPSVVALGANDSLPSTALEAGAGVVAVGVRAHAIATKTTTGRPLVSILVTRSALDEHPLPAGERISAIVLDQPVERWTALLQLAFPAARRVGVLVGPAGGRTILALERSLGERRMTLAVENVVGTEGLLPAIERLVPNMDLFLALPDPLVHNRNTVQSLLLTTYRAGIPVVAYSEAYQQAGAVLALYSTIPQIVSQAVDTLRSFRDGRPVPRLQAPNQFTVGVNTVVAQSLGLRLPPARELGERLRAADQ